MSWEYVTSRRLSRLAIPPQTSKTDSEIFIKGRQFDRLGIMYLGDVEVFRTYLTAILFSLEK